MIKVINAFHEYHNTYLPVTLIVVSKLLCSYCYFNFLKNRYYFFDHTGFYIHIYFVDNEVFQKRFE